MDATDTALKDSTKSGINQQPASNPKPTAAAAEENTGNRRHKRLGMVLNARYRIVSLIASGGMSDVYKAVDLHLEQAGSKDNLVALKILRTSLTRDVAARSLLAREAAKSRRLSHPNIIRVHELNHDGENWFLVMELLDGEPLSRIIQRARPNGLKWKGCKAVLRQVSDALAFSHKQGIVHADLKPSNIFFTKEGTIKLLDFGVSRALQSHQPEDYLNPRTEDETSIYGYTPAYASPDLIAGKDPTPQDDLYALGCISFELLSTRHPFDREKVSERQLAKARLRKPRGMPARFWRVTRQQLRYQPKGSSLDELQATLSPLPWSTWGLTAGTLVVAAIGSAFWHSEYQRAEATERQLAQIHDEQLALATVLDQPPDKLTEAAAYLPDLQKAGVLRLKSDLVLTWYLERIEKILGASARSELPDIPAALALIAEASQLYPRDYDLVRIEAQIRRRQQSLEIALTDDLSARLNEGSYRNAEEFDAVRKLGADLDLIGGDPLQPSGEAAEVFGQQLTSALQDNNDAALARLLTIGDQFFTASAMVSDKLDRARGMEDAIRQLENYHARVADGHSATPFPTQAAEHFYGERFGHWQTAISDARNAGELDRVYQELSVLQERIPSDFAPLGQIRQTLADAYLAQGDALLARNQTRQAQPLLRRATELMRQP
ncbi:serine/threonine-protein kinase [uncultured Marinobacter sp.]|uniref:serine/threonine-protein kinase n=1 Tax=uncultured Marinobacter sp. TaxID=187379 RepID=UPI0030D9A7A3